jgi:hypothetical protein
MQNTYIDIRFEGDRFSPKKLKKLTQLPIEILAEYGEIAKKGRYKNKPTPYGLALLKVEKNGKKDLRTNLFNSIKFLLTEKQALKKSGVEDIIVDIETSPNIEEGFYFDEDILASLSKLKAKIEFHTVKDEKNYRVVAK